MVMMTVTGAVMTAGVGAGTAARRAGLDAAARHRTAAALTEAFARKDGFARQHSEQQEKQRDGGRTHGR
jgi:hypothetical protein